VVKEINIGFIFKIMTL